MRRPLPRPAAGAARFTILSQHAEGGLGRVYPARDEQMRRTVALKEIRPERADHPQVRQRFLAEAEVTGRLEHPGVVPVYALEYDSAGRPVYAMRFIQGRTLDDAIRAYHGLPTALGLRELLQRFISVCQTLAYAHSKGVIDRDLKPANIMLGDYGETLVVDWGLAKCTAPAGAAEAPVSLPPGPAGAAPVQTVDYLPAEADCGGGPLTREGQILGTPAYMAPEQARGEVETLGLAADVYSLGAVLYEVLTGKQPYQGRTVAELLERVLAGPPPAPRSRAGVPTALSAVCLKAMAREPGDRYASAADLARDVERWLADDPVVAYREPGWRRALRWSRRHRTLVTALAVAASLLGLAGVGGAYWWQHQAAAERSRVGRNADALAALLTACGDALRAGDTDRASASLAEIDRRLPEGGGEALDNQLARLRSDLEMAAELDRLENLWWTVTRGAFESPRVKVERPIAFRRFGIVPGQTPVDEAARRVNASAIRESLLGALSQWAGPLKGRSRAGSRRFD